MEAAARKLLNERMELLADAVALEKEPKRVPVVPFICSVAQKMFGSSYRDLYYDYDRAGKAEVEFYKAYPCDAYTFSGFSSGRANELAQSTMLDWPGRPGTKVDDQSSHQAIEHDYVQPEEYKEMLDDFTGFMLRKYIPRAYPALKGLSGIGFVPSIILGTGFLSPLSNAAAAESWQILAEIGKCDAEAAAKSAEYQQKLFELGMPPFYTGSGEVPFDIISDYFRGTLGGLEDQIDYEDEMIEVCNKLADLQIASWTALRDSDQLVKTVHFPLHKGMDGFMSPGQFERLYWAPFRRMLDALVEMGIRPIIYTEGPYNTRLEQICDVPEGKCIVHFETADMRRAKETVGRVACIAGNLPHYLLEYGTKEQVVDYCKMLVDVCAPGGGYIFDTDACLENAKKENLDAMFETMYTYGAK